MRDFLSKGQKIVVKVGTSILTNAQGKIASSHIQQVVENVLPLLREKKQVVLVTSGAIAFGMEIAGLDKRPKQMARLQACAAMGQGRLMNAYEESFSKVGYKTAQLLLTRDGLENRHRFLRARHTLTELFKMNIIPIVNENDTVATDEIAFGDNDILSVHVAHLVHADLLVLLSDVDGFFLKDGSRLREVNSISEIDHELVRHLKDTKKQKTVGGMRAKLEAARTAMKLGVPLLIVDGHQKDVLDRAVKGEDLGTLFFPDRNQKSARKKWIAYAAARKGAVIVDSGAYEALLTNKKSLLPGGVIDVSGQFKVGDVVELQSDDRRVFGRGVTQYASQEISKIAKRKTSEIASILGYAGKAEIVHRNDMVLWT